MNREPQEMAPWRPQDARKRVELSLCKGGGARTRLRALFALFFREADLEEPGDEKLSRLADAIANLGLEICLAPENDGEQEYHGTWTGDFRRGYRFGRASAMHERGITL